MLSGRAFLSRSSTLVALLTFGSPRPFQAFQPALPSIKAFSSTSELNMSAKQVLVPISDGSEEIETTCITDTLARFGAEVTIASVKEGGDLLCTMSRGIKVQADKSIADAAKQEWDLIALPGGMPGASNLRDCEPLVDLLKKQKSQGKRYGAICAAPAVALSSKGLIDDGMVTTCYPAPQFRETLKNFSDDDVVISENLTTSKGPGTALAFALSLGEQLYGKEERDRIAKEMLFE